MSSDDQRPPDERDPKNTQEDQSPPEELPSSEPVESGVEADEDSRIAEKPEPDTQEPPTDRPSADVAEPEPKAVPPEQPAGVEQTPDTAKTETLSKESPPADQPPSTTSTEEAAPPAEPQTPAEPAAKSSESEPSPGATKQEEQVSEPPATEAETSTQQTESASEAPPAGEAQEKPDSSSTTPEPRTGNYYDDPYDDYEYTPPGGAATTTAVAKPPPPPPPPPDEEDDWDSDEEGMVRMSFLEHLEELRTRIIRALIGLVVAYAFCLLFAKQLFYWVTGPVQRAFETLSATHSFDPPLRLVALTPPEQFQLLYLKVPLLAAIFVGAPWLAYQAWGFIAPGLYQRERRWATPFIFSIAGLFVLGGLFGYFVVLRFALVFLLGIGIDVDIQPMISVSSYFNTFVMIELGLGIVFQMPVLIFFLTLLRIVNPSFLLGNIRYAILIIFVLAAVITPTPDVFNMILFAAPMILLFYVGIGASYLLVLKRERGRIPWLRIGSVALLILLAVVAAVLYFMHSQLGYQFIDQFPWFIPPEP